ncbi:sulfite exporter TauE/SafE family protein [Peribacillus saganii]|uniref:Probable membrane transporter protein n=1 Tax=Peribacillus saganii TaxID=2303992 RepID=A0A372LPR0_9BACI|nr:sulfite exporter TauE/SafE family protein [Peribacillus saganii]RFU69265.1 sulfite exporter TauE/SafE family protein [Peribacillus saganii]
MTIGLIITLFIIGLIGSFMSGMLGIGGAIINYPMLLYLPALLGLASFSSHEVSGISTIQALFASISGVWVYRKERYLNKSLISYMGICVFVGSLLGSYGSKLLNEDKVNLVYGVLALIAVIMMFMPKKGLDDKTLESVSFNIWLACVLSLVVGISAGIIGAGGAFLLVPIMLLVLKIPTRVTIASSLAITFISSVGSSVGKITTGQVPLIPAVIVVISSLIAAPLGAITGKKVNIKVLQVLLSVLILAATLKIWIDIL